jgi:hypothetical protein
MKYNKGSELLFCLVLTLGMGATSGKPNKIKLLCRPWQHSQHGKPSRHLEQSTFLDEISDDHDVSGYSSDEESFEGDDYMQLVLLGTHEIGNIDGDDIAICDNQQMGMRRVSRILSW